MSMMGIWKFFRRIEKSYVICVKISKRIPLLTVLSIVYKKVRANAGHLVGGYFNSLGLK